MQSSIAEYENVVNQEKFHFLYIFLYQISFISNIIAVLIEASVKRFFFFLKVIGVLFFKTKVKYEDL